MQKEKKKVEKQKNSQDSVTAERIKTVAYLLFLMKMVPSLAATIFIYLQLVLTPAYYDGGGTMLNVVEGDLSYTQQLVQNANNQLGYRFFNSDGTVNINKQKIQEYIDINGIENFIFLVTGTNTSISNLAYHQAIEGLIDGQAIDLIEESRTNSNQIIHEDIQEFTTSPVPVSEINIEDVAQWLELENNYMQQLITVSRFEQLNINYYDIIFRLLATLVAAGMLAGTLNRERRRMYQKLLKRLQKKTSFIVLSGAETKVIEPFESQYTKEDERAAITGIEDKEIDTAEPYSNLTDLIAQQTQVTKTT